VGSSGVRRKVDLREEGFDEMNETDKEEAEGDAAPHGPVAGDHGLFFGAA
jgi:hypothetical protein